MKRQMSWALLAVGIALAAVAATVAPAVAAASGSETIKGTIVASGVSGTRTVVTSVIMFKGAAFSGVGRIVEVENLPGDPDNVNRDDLVFAGGSMHIVNTIEGFSLSANLCSCVFTVTIPGATKSPAAPGSSPTRPVTSPPRSPDGGSSPQP